MKILITGANGMLAKAVRERFKNEELICTDVAELDITNKEGKTVWDYADDKEGVTEFLLCTLLEESEHD